MILPNMIKISRRFHTPAIDNIEAEIAKELAKPEIARRIRPGARIAITAGSRGVSGIGRIIAAIVAELKRAGAEPFIVPAMGSHGGATAEGQVEVLESLGVTERLCGAPVISSMDTVEIGKTPGGIAVHMDRHASEADGVILVGRIKLHTDFKSPIGLESGLMKMASIGLGKHKEALLLHSYGVHGIRDIMPEVGRVVLGSGHILFGLGIVENAAEQTAILEAIEPERIEERERELLAVSMELYPRLPVEELDILFVDKIGKNYSGTGMDTNTIGRMRIQGTPEPESPRIKYVIAGDLSEESHGNALGIGLADLTTARLVDKIDRKVMNENVITSSFLARASVPIVLDNDREALLTALRSTWNVAPERARIARIFSTLHLEELYVSESVYEEIRSMPDIRPAGELSPFAFDPDGNLLPF
ncbi:lactate racemase domain-containing protein [Paenibacillus humicola]|uniref:lactate racemase domain-containing protein n=1 Tax=Paenibacillus humicola TaxID=3110540 RepID=UPI00237B2D5A|nr:lactate racemase domain-containing protein [Paenibacillus humicola]